MQFLESEAGVVGGQYASDFCSAPFMSLLKSRPLSESEPSIFMSHKCYQQSCRMFLDSDKPSSLVKIVGKEEIFSFLYFVFIVFIYKTPHQCCYTWEK